MVMPVQLATLQLATLQLVTFQLATLTTRHPDNSPLFCKRSTTLTLTHFQTDFNFILNHILMLNLSVEPELEHLHVTAPAPPN
jgi:uncharacterized protein YjaG (DUF416 family)